MIHRYCDSFNIQLSIQKYCKMFEYCKKSLIVTFSPFSNNVIISDYHCNPFFLEFDTVTIIFIAGPTQTGNPGGCGERESGVEYLIQPLAFLGNALSFHSSFLPLKRILDPPPAKKLTAPLHSKFFATSPLEVSRFPQNRNCEP